MWEYMPHVVCMAHYCCMVVFQAVVSSHDIIVSLYIMCNIEMRFLEMFFLISAFVSQQ